MMNREMIENHLIKRGISDPRIIQAMTKIPREEFIPAEFSDKAYHDCALPIGYDQTISQPYINAYMTECLTLDASDKVLEIGTGSGYQTAILASLANTVFSVERVPELFEAARRRLKKLNYLNAHLLRGDGWLGWANNSPYDKIIVTAAAADWPQNLIAQLKDNGKIVFPFGQRGSVQKLLLGTKIDGNLQTVDTISVRFVPLIKS